jgi:ABC-type multidrug transport system ATPase subunit
MSIVECEELTKRYDRQCALDRFTLTVEEGEILGLLGPNGAGKTTLFRLLLGLARPDSGTAKIMGEAIPPPHSVLSRVGAMIEEPAFYGWMSAMEQLRVHSLTGRVRLSEAQIEAALERVGLADARRKRVKKYSQGMRQRLGLARALLHDPKLLVLDEPANGLDPAGIAWLRQLLRELGSSGVTILVSSHQLGEIEKVCSRVAILDRGHLIQLNDVDTIRNSDYALRVVVRPEDAEGALGVLQRFKSHSVDSTTFIVENASGRDVTEALARSLEKRFLEITGKAH